MGKFTAYKLPLKSLGEGTHRYELPLRKDFFVNMESSDIHDADLMAEVTVTHHHDLYDLDITIKGEITLMCDRCLDALQWPVDQSYHIAVKYGESYCDDSDELLEIPFGDPDLNIAYMLYDTVALSIPIKHVHPMGKCNRQMSAILKRHRVTGGNDEDSALEEQLIDEMDTMDPGGAEEPSTDPRWDALKGMKSEE